MGVMDLMAAANRDDDRPNISPLAMLLAGTALKQAQGGPAVADGQPTIPPIMPTPNSVNQAPKGSDGDPVPQPQPTVIQPPTQQPGGGIVTPNQPTPQPAAQPSNVMDWDRINAQRAPIQAEIDKYGKREVVKPGLANALFGALATFGAGYQHNPNAAQIGMDIINRPQANADATRISNLSAARGKLEDFDKGVSMQEHILGTNTAAKRDERDALNDKSLRDEREAKGKMYESRSPKERADALGEVETALGRKMDDQERAFFIVNGKLPQPSEKNKSLSETVDERRQQGTKAGLKGADLTYYSLNGKLREPNPEAEARLQESRDARMQRDQDRKTTEEDRALNRHELRTQHYNDKKRTIDESKRRALDKAEKDFDKRFGDVETKSDKDADKQRVLAEHEGNKAQIEKDFERQYNEIGAPPDLPPSLQKSSQQPTSTPAAGQPPQPGMVRVTKSDGTSGWLPKEKVNAARKAKFIR